MKSLKILIILLCLISITPSANAKKAETTANETVEYMNLNWWKHFGDSTLSGYVEKLYASNPDLKIASIKSKQSQQIMKQAFANQLPQLTFNGGIQRYLTASDQRFGDVLIPDYNQAHYQLPLTMSYEVDIWGENYLKTKSLKKQI